MKKKNGFTLVELLAVIVILAIILVIAVPQIMDTIDSARKGSMESTVKMIAAAAEREYTVRETLGQSTENIACADVATLTADYGACTITWGGEGNRTAQVSFAAAASGKFEGYTCTNGTRTTATCTKTTP